MADEVKKTQVEDIDRSFYDFRYEVNASFQTDAGLTPEIVKQISEEKNDPEWMREFRLKSLEIYNRTPLPNWGPSLEGLNMDGIVTYVRPNTEMQAKWADVPDDMTARLVVLSPKNSFDALSAVRDILDNRGTTPRQWKNMLVFIAADGQKIDDMKDDVREYKAWSEVVAEADSLRLDVVQLKEAKIALEAAKKLFTVRLSQAYRYLIYPESDDNANLKLPLHVEEIDCMGEENLSVAAKYFTSNELLASALGGDVLRRQLDTRNFIWNCDAVKVKLLWEYFAKYYYMPRLLNEKVLLDAVKRAVKAKIFALATDVQDGEYFNLQFGDDFDGKVKPENYLVKAAVAQKIFGEDDTPEVVTEVENVDEVAPVEQTAEPTPVTEAEPLPTKFRMDAKLDKLRLTKNLNSCARDVLAPLLNLPNVKANIRLVVELSIPEGVPTETKKLVEDLCDDKHISDFTFDD